MGKHKLHDVPHDLKCCECESELYLAELYCPNCEARPALTLKKDPSATSPAAMPGYVANLESACFDIYMDFHVSETKNLSPAMKYVWSMGQEIWVKRQNKEAT